MKKKQIIVGIGLFILVVIFILIGLLLSKKNIAIERVNINKSYDLNKGEIYVLDNDATNILKKYIKENKDINKMVKEGRVVFIDKKVIVQLTLNKALSPTLTLLINVKDDGRDIYLNIDKVYIGKIKVSKKILMNQLSKINIKDIVIENDTIKYKKSSNMIGFKIKEIKEGYIIVDVNNVSIVGFGYYKDVKDMFVSIDSIRFKVYDGLIKVRDIVKEDTTFSNDAVEIISILTDIVGSKTIEDFMVMQDKINRFKELGVKMQDSTEGERIAELITSNIQEDLLIEIDKVLFKLMGM